MPRKGKQTEAAAGAVEKTFDLGPPYGKVKAQLTAPWDVVGRDFSVPNTFWPGYKTPKGAPKSTLCKLVGYTGSMPWPNEPGPGYVLRAGKWDYPIRPAQMVVYMTKAEKKRLHIIDSM